MNRNMKLAAMFALIAVLATFTASAADRRLSPALELVASKYSMVKSGKIGNDICFSPDDFEESVGASISSITVTSLPPESDGTLLLGESPVSTGQTISESNLSLLRFIPSGSSDETSFRFTSNRSYSTECIIRMSERTSNEAPCTGSKTVSAVTCADITYAGRLDGSDPDGDEVTFEIISYPTSGIAEITDTAKGTFSYTPYSGYTGRDSFTYRLSDSLGANSEPCTVTLNITPRNDGTEFSDMEGNPAYNAAAELVSDGFMEAIDEHGTLWFDPDENVSREEYLRTVMRALGAPELSAKNSGFTDDDKISDLCSGYVCAARRLGIVTGYETDSGMCFCPDEAITCAEAAVILMRITGAECDSNAPWNYGAISAVISAGIVAGDTDPVPSQLLTRAQMAQLIYNTRCLYNV